MNQDLLLLKINAVYTYTSFSIQPMLKAVLYNKPENLSSRTFVIMSVQHELINLRYLPKPQNQVILMALSEKSANIRTVAYWSHARTVGPQKRPSLSNTRTQQ
jgi:hypothetical protein